MYIDRKLSSVIMVIERIYLPRARDTGTYLSLKSQIETEIHFTTDFFINLIQVTGNLVASAFKCTPSNGSVEVVYTLDTDESKLKMAVKYTGKSIAHDLVSAFRKGKKTETIKVDGEICFAARLHHVMQIILKENGRIFMENGNDSETTFSLMFPIKNKYFNQINGYPELVKTNEMAISGF
ncbi:MAG: hypothetical protein CL666_03920 [Balneola sp.]|nr:hypothetical protein [Balneola sp.]|tara:strand:- start:55493 stop:56035 length:543 start_codon:yes stop_codon:yes gene_type:complete